MTGVSLRHRRRGAPRPPRRARRAASRSHRRASPARAVGESALGVAQYRAAGVTVDLDGLAPRRRRQRAADPRAARRSAGLVGRADSRRAGRHRPAACVDRSLMRRRSRFRIASRSPRSCETTSSALTRRSCRPGVGRCRSRSVGIRTCVCRARPAVAGVSVCRPVGTSPSTPWYPHRRRRDRSARVGADRAPNVR